MLMAILCTYLLISFVSAIEHTKSFLLQENVDHIRHIGVYKDSMLYTSSYDIVQRNIETGMVERTLRAHNGIINGLVVVNGSLLITGGWDNLVIVWDLHTGSVLKRYSFGSSSIMLNTQLVKNNLLLTSGFDGTVRMIDLESNRVSVLARTSVVINAIIIEDYVYSGGFIGSAIKWSLPSFEVVLVFKEHGNPIAAMALGDEFLFTAGADLGIFQSNITNGLAVNIISGHSIRIDALVTSNSLLFSAGLDYFIKLWDITAGVSVMTYNLAETVGAMLVDGQDLIVAGDTGISKFVIATGERKIYLTETFVSYALIANTLLLFTGCEDSKIRVRDLNTLNILEVFHGHTDSITALYLTDSTILFSTGFDGTIKKWNMVSRTVAFSFENRGSAVTSLIYNGGSLFVGLRTGHIVSYDLITTQTTHQSNFHGSSVNSMVSTGNDVLSASVHGIIAKHLVFNLEETLVIYNDSSEGIRSLHASENYFGFILANR
ncbi:hypothetical protein MP638_004986 [Amoeboaphelidium occidentale]|nr:hypothetical protein MP638_004986 [Amoeboaphelidium occidentale]